MKKFTYTQQLDYYGSYLGSVVLECTYCPSVGVNIDKAIYGDAETEAFMLAINNVETVLQKLATEYYNKNHTTNETNS